MNILVVDDHRDTTTVITRLLEREGHRVSSALGSDEAVTIARALRFDVVLCDIGMPEKDGFQCLQALRTLYPAYIIALTGYGMPEEVKRIVDAGFDNHLLKPIEWSCLQAIVNEVGLSQRALEFNCDRKTPLATTFKQPGEVPSSTTADFSLPRPPLK